ncbi:hypothetical protein ACHAXT_001667 [Thalassiosira profunda]
MNELQLLRNQEATASRRVAELQKIVADESTSIVKRSKATLELSGLQSSHKVLKARHDASGIVAQNKERVEREIRRNEERARREEEIRRLQELLRDEGKVKSAERRRELEAELRAAEAAIERLDVEEAEEEKTAAAVPYDVVKVESERSSEPVASISAKFQDMIESKPTVETVVSEEEQQDAQDVHQPNDGTEELSDFFHTLDVLPKETSLLTKETSILSMFSKESSCRTIPASNLGPELPPAMVSNEEAEGPPVGVIAVPQDEEGRVEEKDVAEGDAIDETEDDGVEAIERPEQARQPSQRRISVADIKQLVQMSGPSDRRLSLEEIKNIVVAEDNENADRIGKLEALVGEKDQLVKHWKDKATTLARKCLSLEVNAEEREKRIAELQDWKKIQDERIVSLQNQTSSSHSGISGANSVSPSPSLSPRPSLYNPRSSIARSSISTKASRHGSRRFSAHALLDPSFEETLRRAAASGSIEEQIKEEAAAEVIALEERLATMDGEREQLMCELETMKAILQETSQSKGKKKKGKRLVYQLSCRKCNNLHFVGTTRKGLDKTMERHVNAVVKEVKSKGSAADHSDQLENWSPDFAAHFAKHINGGSKRFLLKRQASDKEVRRFCQENVKVEVLRRQDGAELMWEEESTIQRSGKSSQS